MRLEPRYQTQHSKSIYTKKNLQAAIILATILATSPPSKGEVETDGTGKTRVERSANGTELVNINNADKNGVSKNSYHKFNIDRQGLILNNSKEHSRTQLGGAILGNTNMSGANGREASIILNQVIGASRSDLNGYLEIAGKRADIIIANENGISCTGCGFINTNRASLVTGIHTGDTQAMQFRLNPEAKLSITNLGNSKSGLKILDLVSNQMILKGNITATEAINLRAGDDKYNYHSNSTTSSVINNEAREIDAVHLGAMQAGSISIIGSKEGLGVTFGQSSELIAAAGGLYMDIYGNLNNNGRIYASLAQIKSGNKISNAGEIQSTTLELTSKEIANTGKISSNGNSKYSTEELTNEGIIYSAQELEIKANNLTNSNKIQAEQLLKLELEKLTNRGEIESEQELQAQIANLTNYHTIRYGKGTITGVNISNEQTGTIESDIQSEITLTGEYSNHGTTNLKDATIEAKNISNWNEITLTGASSLKAHEGLTNQASGTTTGKIYGEHLKIAAQTINNYGVLAGTKKLELTASTITNQYSDHGGALIYGGEEGITIKADTLTNRSNYHNGIYHDAMIYSNGNLNIEGQTGGYSKSITNQGGTIQAQQDINIKVTNLTNKGNVATYKTRVWDEAVGGGAVSKNGSSKGINKVDQYHYIRASNYKEGQINSKGNLHIDSNGTVTNERSHIKAGGDIQIGALTFNNIQGDLERVSARSYVDSFGWRTYYLDDWGFSITKGQGTVHFTNYDPQHSIDGSINSTLTAGGNILIQATNGITNGNLKENVQTSDTPTTQEIKIEDKAISYTDGKDYLIENPFYRRSEGSDYLIETDSKLTNINNLIGSQYFLDRIQEQIKNKKERNKYQSSLDKHPKIIGDAHYEQRLIQEQLNQRNRPDLKAKDANQLMKELYNNASSAQQELKLSLGVALTADQINNLKQDIIWYEEQTVYGQKVLVPKLYTAQSKATYAGATIYSTGDIDLTSNHTEHLNEAETKSLSSTETDKHLQQLYSSILNDPQGSSQQNNPTLNPAQIKQLTKLSKAQQQQLQQLIKAQEQDGKVQQIQKQQHQAEEQRLEQQEGELALLTIQEQKLKKVSKMPQSAKERKAQNQKLEAAREQMNKKAAQIQQSKKRLQELAKQEPEQQQGLSGYLTQLQHPPTTVTGKLIAKRKEQLITNYLKKLKSKGSINNHGNLIAGKAIKLKASNDINSSELIQGESGEITAGNNINLTSQTKQENYGNNSDTYITSTSRTKIKNKLHLTAGEDINLTGAQLQAKRTKAKAKNITIAALELYKKRTQYRQSKNTKETQVEQWQKWQGSKIEGDFDIQAKGNLNIIGSELKSEGTSNLKAGGNLNIYALQDSYSKDISKVKYGNGITTGDETTTIKQNKLTTRANKLQAKDLGLTAAETITIAGSAIQASNNLEVETKKLNMQTLEDIESYSKTVQGENILWQTDKGEGYYKSTNRSSTLRGKQVTMKVEAAELEIVPQGNTEEALRHHVSTNPQDKWMIELHQAGKMRLIGKENAKEQWEYDNSRLSSAAQIAVAVATTVATSGIGTGATGAMLSAGAGSLATTASVTGLNSLGRGEGLSKAINSSVTSGLSYESIKNALRSSITAGITYGVNKKIDGLNKKIDGVNKYIDGFENGGYIRDAIIRGTARGVNSMILGGKFEDGMLQGARSSLLRDIVAGLADTKPGELEGNEQARYKDENTPYHEDATNAGREHYDKNKVGKVVPQEVIDGKGWYYEGSRTMKAAGGFLGTEYAKWHDKFVSGDPEAWAIGSNFVMVPIYFKYAWYTNTRASNLMKNIEEAKRVNNQESSKQPTHNSTITTGELYKQYQQIIYGSSYNEYQINDKLSINNQINNDTHTTYN